jgi:hypothetical protein
MKKKLLTLAGLLMVNGLAFGQPNTIQVIVHNTGTASVWLQGIAQGGTFWNLGNPSGTQVLPGTTFTSAVQSGWIPYTDVLQWYPADSSCNESATINSTSLVVTANPGVAEYYIGGGCGTQTGGGAPPSTNSEYCCTVNNTSGAGQLYGLANVDSGLPYGLDSCGDTLMYVPPGQSTTICTDASPTAHVALFTATGPVLGLTTTCGGIVNPNPDGTLASTNLIGTPIPIGSGTQPGNTNVVTIGFGSSGSQYTNNNPANSPINFNTTNTGVASNGTLMQGFSAEFAELVTIAGAVKQGDIDTQGSLAGIKSIETGIASSVSPLHGDLGGIATSLTGINSSVSGVTSAVNSVGTDVNALKPDLDGILTDANSLPGMSNLLGAANASLAGMSNGIADIVSNTGASATAFTEVAHFATNALAAQTESLAGPFHTNWDDGYNVGLMTNYASGVAGGAMTGLDRNGSALQSVSGNYAGDFPGGDSSFWTLSLPVGGKTYSFDLNPLDNLGIARLAALARNWETWLICCGFVLLVANLMENYVHKLSVVTQTQALRMEIFGCSIGQAAALAYLPIMIGCVAAVPLFLWAAVQTGVAGAWFTAIFNPPWGAGTFSTPESASTLTEAFWFVDQWVPLNFVIGSFLYYLGIRLAAVPIFTTSVVVLKCLVS